MRGIVAITVLVLCVSFRVIAGNHCCTLVKGVVPCKLYNGCSFITCPSGPVDCRGQTLCPLLKEIKGEKCTGCQLCPGKPEETGACTKYSRCPHIICPAVVCEGLEVCPVMKFNGQKCLGCPQCKPDTI